MQSDVTKRVLKTAGLINLMTKLSCIFTVMLSKRNQVVYINIHTKVKKSLAFQE
jgi:hypothetical protein